MFRTERHRITSPFAILAALLSVVALSACASPSHPTGAIAHHPAPRPSRIATATATPEPRATCDTVVPLNVARAALTSTAVTAQPYYLVDGGAPPELHYTAVLLDGGLQCLWQERPTDPEYSLAVEIVPNGSAAFSADSAAMESSDDGHGDISLPGIPTYGDASFTQCLNIDADWQGECTYNIMVGNYWVVVDTVNRHLVTPYPETSAEIALLGGVVSAVREMPSSPVMPHRAAESVRLPGSCAAVLPIATLRTTLGDPTLADIPDPNSSSGMQMVNSAAGVAAHELRCYWLTDGGALVSFDLIPGSDVAWSPGTPPTGATASGMTALSGVGAAAYRGCTTDASDSTCRALVLVGHTWFELNEDAPTTISSTAFDSVARQIASAMG